MMRLKQRLGIGSDEFLDRHADVVLRPGSHFPDVLLRMSDERRSAPAPFSTPSGCTRLPGPAGHLPDLSARAGPRPRRRERAGRGAILFPAAGVLHGGSGGERLDGPGGGSGTRRPRSTHWMTVRWAQVRRRFDRDPWGPEGPEGKRARMAFMAAYNVDRFREFVFASSFLKRFKINPELVAKIRRRRRPAHAARLRLDRALRSGYPSSRISRGDERGSRCRGGEVQWEMARRPGGVGLGPAS
ncbi:MAG: YkgJ family cysteine cluster protein [Desulfobacterales bacterium]|nr:YkgJ family cysteine cluster protein [Desulfobacterales bacterium]